MFHAQTVAVIFAVLPWVNAVPSVEAITRQSFDSSEWKVPELPSVHELLIVFGWFTSVPPDMVPRPNNSDAPESQDDAADAHCGAFSVLL